MRNSAIAVQGQRPARACLGAVLPRVSRSLRVGDMVPYISFIETVVGPSTLPSSGDGLFSMNHVPQFTWIGFYPGDVSKRFNGKKKDHTMGTTVLATNGKLDDPREKAFIIASASVKEGMHMVNEAGRSRLANVWYVKLDNGFVLYFSGVAIQPQEELLTCYSRSYGKRSYPIPQKCSDPRCSMSSKHRVHSEMLAEWRLPLMKQAESLRDAGAVLPPDFLGRAQPQAQAPADGDQTAVSMACIYETPARAEAPA